MTVPLRANLLECERAAGDLQKALQLDPMTIAIIVQAIIAALRLWMDCREKKRRWRRRIANKMERLYVRTAIVKVIGEAGWQRIGEEDFLDALIAKGLSYRDNEIADNFVL